MITKMQFMNGLVGKPVVDAMVSGRIAAEKILEFIKEN